MKSVKGKISIIRHPIVKGKNGISPMEGDWKYNDGVLSKWYIYGKKQLVVPMSLKSVEIDHDIFKLLAGLKKSNEFSPEFMTLMSASPILAYAYQDKKLNNLLKKRVLFRAEFKEGCEPPISFFYCKWTDSFMAFTTFEVYAHMHDILLKKQDAFEKGA